jgi:hypothetical protein
MHSQYHNTPDDFVPFRILMAIARRADVNGVTGIAGDQANCPSRGTIADEAKVHKNTVDNWLPILAQSGELSYEVYGQGRARHTVYRLLLPLDDVPLTPIIDTSYPGYANIVTSNQTSDVPIHSHNDTRQLELLTQQVALLTQQIQVLTQHIVTNATSDQRGGVHDPVLDPILDPLDSEGEESPPPPLRRPNHDFDTLLEGQGEAVRLYVNLSGHWPGETNAGYIVERLGDCPDSAALERALRLWAASGYRSGNLPGLFDWYDELVRDPAWTPGNRFKARASPNGNGHGPDPPPRKLSRSEQAAAEYAAEKARLLGLT